MTKRPASAGRKGTMAAAARPTARTASVSRPAAEAFSMVEPGYQSGKRQTGRKPPEKAWATARGREPTGWEGVSQAAGERGARGPRRGSPRASEPRRSIRTFPLRGPYEAVRDRGKKGDRRISSSGLSRSGAVRALAAVVDVVALLARAGPIAIAAAAWDGDAGVRALARVVSAVRIAAQRAAAVAEALAGRPAEVAPITLLAPFLDSVAAHRAAPSSGAGSEQTRDLRVDPVHPDA